MERGEAERARDGYRERERRKAKDSFLESHQTTEFLQKVKGLFKKMITGKGSSLSKAP